MMYKILQGSDTASGTVLQKRCSSICGLNPAFISKTERLKRYFSRILIATITIIA